MRLVENWWTILLHSTSSWISTVIGGLVGLVGVHWAVLLGILPFMPFYLQLPMSIVIGVTVIAGPILTARVTHQPKLDARLANKSAAKEDA